MRRTFVIIAALAAAALAAPAGAQQRACTGDCPQRSEEARRELARAQAELTRLTQLMARGDSLDPAVLGRIRLELVEAMQTIERLQSDLVEERQARAMTERRVFIRQAPRADRGGWLGISFSSNFEVDEDRHGRAFRFEGYPVIEAVEPGSPARRAGVEVGDVLLRMGGRDMTRERIALDELLKPGHRLELQVRRDGKVRTLTAAIVERPREMTLAPLPPLPPGAPAPDRVRVRVSGEPVPRAPSPPAPPAPPVVLMSTSMVALAGAEMALLPREMRGQVGVDGGMLVLRVGLGTPAARGGLREGDVIVAVDGHPVDSSGDLRMAFRRAMEARKLTLDVRRQGKPAKVEVAW